MYKLKITHLAIAVTISVGLFAVSHDAFAEDAASFAKIYVVYHSSANIIDVTGVVYKTFSQNYALTIFDPQGRLIFVSQPQLSQDNTFSQSIVPSSTLWSESGSYTVKMASGPQVLANKSFYFPGTPCCVQNSQGVQAGLSGITNVIDSPLKQFGSGMALKDVKCKNDFQLVIKAEDHTPACIKPEDISKLVERGWAVKPQSLQEQLDFANVCIGPNEACKHRFDSTYVTSENQTSSVEPTACDTPYNPKSGYQGPLYHNGTRISTDYTSVFYMPLNSTGKLCVHYNNWNQPTQVGIRIFEANDLTQDAKTITISGSHTVPSGNSSTVYTINSGNKAGFYGLSFVCGGMPFAVGYDNHSRIVSSDFPWLKETFMCPAITFNSDITGTSGIGTYYIAETTREQIGYNITGISVSSTHLSPTSQNVTFTLNVRTYDTGAKLWFDFKDSNAIKFIGDPILYEESNPCNWTFNNDRSVDNAQWLKLVGSFRVTDNPVTIPAYSNGTYTFSIFAKNLDHGWYGLSPIIFSESSNSNIPLQNLGGSAVASYYPITMGLDSNLDPSGVCDR